MGWSAAGAVVGAAIGAGTSIYINRENQKDADKKWVFSQTVNAQAAYADAQATKGAAGAEASAIKAQAAAEATAYTKQAEVERNLLYTQAEAARNIAYDNITKMQAEADESLRRLEGEQQSWEAKARAKAAASGVRQEGSTALSLSALDQENDRQAGWLKSSYDSGIAVGKKSAEAESAATKRQGDAAVQAGKIQATAAQQAASALAGSVIASGYYFAEALRQKGDAYMATIKGGGARQQARDKIRADNAAIYASSEGGM